METRAARYEIKAVGWEIAAKIAAFVGILFSGLFFLFLIFQAAHLIGLYNHSIDTSMYIKSHGFTLFIEIILWTIMARASIRFKAYTRAISPSRDGDALSYIADAMVFSIVYAILFDMASTFKTLFIHTPQLGVITTITNLLPLALFMIITVLLYVGSHKLKRLKPDNAPQKQRHWQIVSLSLALFALFVFPFAEYFYHIARIMIDDDGLHHFVLSPNILIAVYIVPFCVVWLLGLLSCVNLAEYANRVTGKIYKPMFRNLYLGILLSYISTFLIQIWYTSNLPANRFGFGLLSLLILIVLLIIGYSLMYRGANRLYSLEQ